MPVSCTKLNSSKTVWSLGRRRRSSSEAMMLSRQVGHWIFTALGIPRKAELRDWRYSPSTRNISRKHCRQNEWWQGSVLGSFSLSLNTSLQMRHRRKTSSKCSSSKIRFRLRSFSALSTFLGTISGIFSGRRVKRRKEMSISCKRNQERQEQLHWPLLPKA